MDVDAIPLSALLVLSNELKFLERLALSEHLHLQGRVEEKMWSEKGTEVWQGVGYR